MIRWSTDLPENVAGFDLESLKHCLNFDFCKCISWSFLALNMQNIRNGIVYGGRWAFDTSSISIIRFFLNWPSLSYSVKSKFGICEHCKRDIFSNDCFHIIPYTWQKIWALQNCCKCLEVLYKNQACEMRAVSATIVQCIAFVEVIYMVYDRQGLASTIHIVCKCWVGEYLDRQKY